MSGTSFTAAEVIDILKACRDTGVAEFEGGGFRVALREDHPKAASWSFELPELPPAPAPTAPIQAEPDHEKQNQEALELEELRLKETQIAELLVTDPLAAEEMIQKGDMVEDVEQGHAETA